MLLRPLCFYTHYQEILRRPKIKTRSLERRQARINILRCWVRIHRVPTASSLQSLEKQISHTLLRSVCMSYQLDTKTQKMLGSLVPFLVTGSLSTFYNFEPTWKDVKMTTLSNSWKNNAGRRSLHTFCRA